MLFVIVANGPVVFNSCQKRLDDTIMMSYRKKCTKYETCAKVHRFHILSSYCCCTLLMLYIFVIEQNDLLSTNSELAEAT